MSGIDEELANIRDTLGKLKKQLYTKFGSNINLVHLCPRALPSSRARTSPPPLHLSSHRCTRRRVSAAWRCSVARLEAARAAGCVNGEAAY